MKDVLHLIEEDLDHWIDTADIVVRCEFGDLLDKYAEFQERYPET